MSPTFVRRYAGWYPAYDMVSVTREASGDVYRMRLIRDGLPDSHIDVIVYTCSGPGDACPAGAGIFVCGDFSATHPFVFTPCDLHTATEATKRLAEKIADPDGTICDIGPCSPATDRDWAVLNEIREWDGQPFEGWH